MQWFSWSHPFVRASTFVNNLFLNTVPSYHYSWDSSSLTPSFSCVGALNRFFLSYLQSGFLYVFSHLSNCQVAVCFYFCGLKAKSRVCVQKNPDFCLHTALLHSSTPILLYILTIILQVLFEFSAAYAPSGSVMERNNKSIIINLKN